MDSVRQRQIAENIRREMSAVFQLEGRNIYGQQALVTITGVRITPDLGTARIYLSVFNAPSTKEAVLDQINENHYRLRSTLTPRIRSLVRRIPTIEFFLDDTLDEVEKLDRLFDEIKKQDGQIGS
jgi:ribosome-binding factor A